MESTTRRRGGWLAAGFATLGLGCQTLPGPAPGRYGDSGPYPDPSRVAQGAILGSLAGAAIGAGVDHHDRGRGALVGAVGGLLAGALFGGELERYEESRRYPYRYGYRGGGPRHDGACHGAHDPYGHAHGDCHAFEDAPRDGYDGYGAGGHDAHGHGDHTFEAEPEVHVAEPIAPDVLFDPDSAVLSRGAKSRLRRVADRVRRGPDIELLLRGHADGLEGGGDRFALSEQRARAVRAYLTEEGVPTRRIAWVGFGATQPVASNRSPEGRQRNRRVEIVLREPA